MTRTIRWGILGPGSISGTWAKALREATGAELAAVGSRDAQRAQAFATGYGFARAHGSYADLAADPDVDAIYVGTPHSRHERDSVLCLEHGKHVLCEKPLAINAAQARRMIDAARANDRLLMEAMWTRFLPSLAFVRETIDAGAIGDVRTLTSDFGIAREFEADHRLFAAELGGGALLDLGVYAVSLSSWLFGDPVEIAGAAHLGPTGVDDESAFVLKHEGGRITSAFQATRLEGPREAVIRGTGGSILLHEPWWGAARVSVERAGTETETRSFDLKGRGYTYLADAFMELIRAGRRESETMPPAESLRIMETMDTLRARWGLRYPGE